MTMGRKQVIFLFFTVLSSFFYGGHAIAAELTATAEGKKEREKAVLSVDAVWEGVKTVWPSTLFSKEKNKEDKKEDTKKDSIILKEGEAPYKIYRAPILDKEENPFTRLDQKNRQEKKAGQPQEEKIAEQATQKARDARPSLGHQFLPILPIGAGENTEPLLLPFVSNQDLSEITEQEAKSIQRAIIVIHDIDRDAQSAVADMATLAGAEGEAILILAPQFLLQTDLARFEKHLSQSHKNIAAWNLDGQSLGQSRWEYGGTSETQTSKRGISSFTALDMLLMYSADKRRFPNLQTIIIAGHGSGADFSERYAATSRAIDFIEGQRIAVRFLAANPSSYLYLTNYNPTGHSLQTIELQKEQPCPDRLSYPYGVQSLNAYARHQGLMRIRDSYRRRHIMVLLSDKLKRDPFLDRHCAAEAQGLTRASRGKAYATYLALSFGAQIESSHSFTIVPEANYDSVALFGSYCGQAILFGDGFCRSNAN